MRPVTTTCGRLSIAICLAVACAGSVAAAAEGELLRKPPYVSCNVNFRFGCFGIASGDVLTMKIPGDFVLYHINFAFGRDALVYLGAHPDVSKDKETPFQPCAGDHGFAECKTRAFKDGGYELLGRSKSGYFVHALVPAGGGHEPEIASFLADIRGCTSREDSITCPPSRAKAGRK